MKVGLIGEPHADGMDLVNSTGLVGLDLGSLANAGTLQQLGGPLSAVELHFVRRVAR
jgi:predicted dinucleotide-binding enzyme